MLRCKYCGEVIGEEELVKRAENPMIYGGHTESYRCPCCGAPFRYDDEQGELCEVCGKFFSSEFGDDEGREGICDGCLDGLLSVETLLELGEEGRAEIEINGFLRSAFSVSEIEEILTRELLSLPPSYLDRERREYIDTDKDWFAETLKMKRNAAGRSQER